MSILDQKISKKVEQTSNRQRPWNLTRRSHLEQIWLKMEALQAQPVKCSSAFLWKWIQRSTLKHQRMPKITKIATTSACLPKTPEWCTLTFMNSCSKKRTRCWMIWGIKWGGWLNRSPIRSSNAIQFNASKVGASSRGIRRRQNWILLLLKPGRKIIYWKMRLIGLSTMTKTMAETSSNSSTLLQTRTNNSMLIMNWRTKYWSRRRPRCPSKASSREATSLRLWLRLQTSSQLQAQSSARPSIEAEAMRIRRVPTVIKPWCTKADFW